MVAPKATKNQDASDLHCHALNHQAETRLLAPDLGTLVTGSLVYYNPYIQRIIQYYTILYVSMCKTIYMYIYIQYMTI